MSEPLALSVPAIGVDSPLVQLGRNADGTVRIVIAHEDPGLPNYLTTAGHAEGSMLLRWVDADRHPTPACRVVKLASLASEGARPVHGARA